MNSSKKQKVSNKIRVYSVTTKKQSTLPVIDNVTEVQLNTNTSRDLEINNKLNHDCLAKVLMYLSVPDRLEMEKVCQKWKEASEMSFCAVKQINFNDLIITLDKKEETWKKLLEKYGRYLKDLTISYEYSWICNVIKKKCRNITRFDIDMSVMYVDEEHPFEVLLQAVRTMSKLNYLKVKVDTYESRNFFTQLLEVLPRDIEEIHLVAVEYELDDDIDWIPTISVVPDKFENLRCLTLQGFRLNQTIMELISLNNNTLVHLDLFRCDSSPDVSVFSRLCNLEYLNLDRIKNLDYHVITAIAHNCQKLNHFEYANERKVVVDDDDEFDEDNDDDEFGEIYVVPNSVFRELKYLKNLEYLYFQGINNTFDDNENLLSCIANNCGKLKHIDVRSQNRFSTSDVKEITKLKNLESLNLKSKTINSELLIDVANNCLALKDLNENLDHITEIALKQLTNLKKIEKLQFYECENLTGNLLINIVNNCKNLINLDLSSCNNITEASLIQVGNLQHLKRLDISFIQNVPNAMFSNFHKLEYLSCALCPSVTDEGIMKVIDNCQNLNHLNMYKSGVSVKLLIHASKRQCIVKMLRIIVGKSIRENYHSGNAFKSPYLYV